MYWRRAQIQDGQATTNAWWRHSSGSLQRRRSSVGQALALSSLPNKPTQIGADTDLKLEDTQSGAKRQKKIV